MNTAYHNFDRKDDDASLLQAAVLMQRAIDLLDLAGEVRAAVHLQHAIDTLATRLPVCGQPH
jgi:hypothetical protein